MGNIFNIGYLGGKKGTDKSKAAIIPIEDGDSKTTDKSDAKKPKSPEVKESVKDTAETVEAQPKAEPAKESQPDEVTKATVEQAAQEEKVIPPRKIVKICKTGTEHLRSNVNNQDFSFSFMNLKAVCDGCGSGKHSEVGSRLFGQMLAGTIANLKLGNFCRLSTLDLSEINLKELKESLDKGEISEALLMRVVRAVFVQMLMMCHEPKFVFENYCFTILVCLEYENEFVVYSCGDGFIIEETSEGITFEKLDDGEYPAYYVYNWIDPTYLEEYKDGVSFKVTHFPKTEYVNVGVASDGLRFFDDLYDPDKYKFKDYLSLGKGPQIEMIISRNNNNSSIFKDDISICF